MSNEVGTITTDKTASTSTKKMTLLSLYCHLHLAKKLKASKLIPKKIQNFLFLLVLKDKNEEK